VLKTHVIDLHGLVGPSHVSCDFQPCAQCAQDGKDVPVGSIGEVLLKTPSLPLGYWEDPEATKELFQDGAWTVVGFGANWLGLDHFSGNWLLSFFGANVDR